MAELVLTSVADAAAALDHATSQVSAGEVAQCLAIAALCDLPQVDETVLVDGCERWVTTRPLEPDPAADPAAPPDPGERQTPPPLGGLTRDTPAEPAPTSSGSGQPACPPE